MQMPSSVYIYPSNSKVHLLAQLHEILNDLGLDPLPIFRLPSLRSFKNRPYNTVMFHWLEDAPYAKNINALSAFLSFVKCLCIIAVSCIFAQRRMWVKHNIHPHNTERSLFYFRVLQRVLCFICQKTVVLEPYAVKDPEQECFALHPLRTLNDNSAIIKATRDIEFGFYGYIHPYKNLCAVLSSWPKACKLTIRGQCPNKDYEKQLIDIIKQRELPVDFIEGYVDEAQYNALLQRTKAVILPHASKQIITSGIYYHAISYGCNILVGDSEFAKSKLETQEYVHSLNTINNIDLFRQSLVLPEDVIKQAHNTYGNEKVKASWQSALCY